MSMLIKEKFILSRLGGIVMGLISILFLGCITSEKPIESDGEIGYGLHLRTEKNQPSILQVFNGLQRKKPPIVFEFHLQRISTKT